MATVYYSMAGEGRGHATRVRTMVEDLRARHRMVLLAPGDAHAFLEPLYRADDQVDVVEIPGPRFAYNSQQRVSIPGTTRLASGYLKQLPGLVRSLSRRLRDEGAQLLITDYEPAGPRAAERAGVPYLALDHQSFFNVADLGFLPAPLQRSARRIARFNRVYYSRQVHTISSSFFLPELLPGAVETTLVGPLLRPNVRSATPEQGGHVLAYCRRKTPPAVMEALAACGREVRIYGLGELPDNGKLRYRPISEAGFVADLASCLAVVASAGNQLLGETLCLGKRAFALPEGGQDEQVINGHYLERMHGGLARDPEQVRPGELSTFLDALELGDLPPGPRVLPGNDLALERLEDALSALGPALSRA